MNYINLKPKSFNVGKELTKANETKKIINQIELKSKESYTMVFNIKNKTDPFTYNGLKIIYCDNPSLLIKQIINPMNKYTNIELNENVLKNENVIIINPLTKISEILNCKVNGIIHKYLKAKNVELTNKLIEEFIIKTSIEVMDENLNNLTSLNMKNASILEFLSIEDDYINENNIKNVLNIIKESQSNKYTIIINDYNILTVEKIISDYSINFNFLIFTNNFKNWISQKELLPLLVIMKDFLYDKYKLGSIEIVDEKCLVDFIHNYYKFNKLNKIELETWLTNKKI